MTMSVSVIAYELLSQLRFPISASIELKQAINTGFNKIKNTFPSLTQNGTVKNTIFYLWQFVFLLSSHIFEMEAAATCTETPLPYPYFAGSRLL
jgi:hypothetical protein